VNQQDVSVWYVAFVSKLLLISFSGPFTNSCHGAWGIQYWMFTTLWAWLWCRRNIVDAADYCGISGVVSRGSWRLTGHQLHSPLDHVHSFLHICLVVLQYRVQRVVLPECFCVLSVRRRRQGCGKTCCRFSITRQGACETGGIFRCQPGRPLHSSEGPHRN